MEFVETLSFWCPHVDRATCNNFSTQTVGAPENPPFFLFFFPFLFFFFVSPSTNSFSFLSFFSFLYSFFSFHFLLISSSHFSSFFSFAFLISFLFFLSSSTNSFCSFWHFLLPFGSSLTDWSRKEASFPFPHATCVVYVFPSLFLYFLIPFVTSSIMWLIVSHIFKCTTWLLPCVTLLGYHVASP